MNESRKYSFTWIVATVIAGVGAFVIMVAYAIGMTIRGDFDDKELPEGEEYIEYDELEE